VEDSTPLNEQQIAVEVQQDVNLRRGADLLLARKVVDPNRLAYVGHSCDGSAGGFLSGTEKRFKAFVIMAGDLSFDIDKKTSPSRNIGRRSDRTNSIPLLPSISGWMVENRSPTLHLRQCFYSTQPTNRF
jgi:hypothetical protein